MMLDATPSSNSQGKERGQAYRSSCRRGLHVEVLQGERQQALASGANVENKSSETSSRAF